MRNQVHLPPEANPRKPHLRYQSPFGWYDYNGMAPALFKLKLSEGYRFDCARRWCDRMNRPFVGKG